MRLVTSSPAEWCEHDGNCTECVTAGYCPKRDDQTHCDHWWDGEPCCDCGDDSGEVTP